MGWWLGRRVEDGAGGSGGAPPHRNRSRLRKKSGGRRRKFPQHTVHRIYHLAESPSDRVLSVVLGRTDALLEKPFSREARLGAVAEVMAKAR